MRLFEREERIEPEIKDTSGFYSLVEGELRYAPNFVWNKEYTLDRKEKDKYKFPSYGWYWFDTRQEALDFFKIEDEIDTRKSYTGEEVKAILDKAKISWEKAIQKEH